MSLKHFLPVLLLTLCFCGSCNLDVDLNCKSGSFTDEFAVNEFEESVFAERIVPFLPETFQYRIEGDSAVYFTIGKSIDQICPEIPALVTYQISTTELTQPREIFIVANAGYGTSHQGGFTHHTQSFRLTPVLLSPSTIYQDSMNVFLSSLFENQDASMDVYFSFRFEPSMGFTEDSLYLVTHIQSIQITTQGDLY